MLSEATNELLTRVGPGTRMGDYLRRYWHPIAGESELREPGTLPCRLLGEDLVLYRDLSGSLGLLDRHCPHRRADLSYGYVESNGLRCNYHGWRFDSAGRCLEQPFDDVVNPGARSCDKAVTRAYPVRAHGGLLWAYLGPQPAPLIPDWEPFRWKNGFVQVFLAELPCNWLQCQENAIDPVHLEWMHMNWAVRQSGRTGPYSPRHLKIGFDETEYGYVYRRVTEATSEDDDLWKVGRVTLWPNGFYAADHFDWHVPIDDRRTLRVSWAFARVPHEKEPYEQPLPVPAWRGPVRDGEGRWLSDRPVNQDFVALAGQGAVADRTKERLAASDQGVILMRRRLLAELDAVAEGAEPKALIRDPARNEGIRLPCPDRQIYLDGLPLREMLAHPSVGAMIRAYPFQAGEPPEVRQAFRAAMGLDEPEAQVTDASVADQTLSDLIESFWTTQLIGTAVTLGIPDRLGDGAKTHEQLASSCEADAPSVLRVLRGLQTVGVCRVTDGSKFELTARGQLLRRGVPRSMSGRALFTSGIMWDLYRQLVPVVKSGQSLPSGREGFDRLANDPRLAGMHQAMVESSIRIIADATRVHDFGRYARVLDVGGGYGGALTALLQRYRDMSGGVLDLAYLANDSNAYLRNSGVAERAGFVTGDFFEAVPTGYDCYLLKYIIHDWGDDDAVQILRRCAAAARPSAHVILLERILPDVLEECRAHQTIMQIDLAMMTTGGKERTVAEYRRLLASAGLELTAIQATRSPCSLIQAVPVRKRASD